ncbi:hypothetical protein [Arcticibacter sp.]|jgi:hypothetical protein|uniref:hypothetical protein n=1 Tax=Arcticibacter sp. TaxID=1872630 RepID=UPI0038910146
MDLLFAFQAGSVKGWILISSFSSKGFIIFCLGKLVQIRNNSEAKPLTLLANLSAKLASALHHSILKNWFLPIIGCNNHILQMGIVQAKFHSISKKTYDS